MNKQFLTFLAVGLAVACGIWYFFYASTKDMALAVSGEILKVRTVELSPHNVFLMTDFRVRNTSAVDFMLKEASIFVTMADGQEKEGHTVARSDIDNIMQYTPLAGPKFNQVLVMRDRVAAKVSIDRMAGATFAVEEQDLQARKKIRLHLTDLDGKEFDLLEKSAQ